MSLASMLLSSLRAAVVDMIDEPRDGVRARLRPDAVAQVEYVARRRAPFLQHEVGMALELRRGRKQRRRIEVALHGLVGAQQPADLAERRAPVHSDHIDVQIGNGSP